MFKSAWTIDNSGDYFWFDGECCVDNVCLFYGVCVIVIGYYIEK